MKYSIVLINCFFGALPEYSKYFFDSCKYNPTIHFLLITDQKIDYRISNNVEVIRMSFAEFKNMMQSKFEFNIVLEAPYKICDYKPAFGYVLSEYIHQYDFWGHCDLDMILGDIRSFLPDTILGKYEKIYQHGHLCLYKNTMENNKRFMSPIGMNYMDVFTSPRIFVFDEQIGMQQKFDLMNLETYKEIDYFNIDDKFYKFRRTIVDNCKDSKHINFSRQVFFWENGKVFRQYFDCNHMVKNEYNYIHFSNRKLKYNQISESNSFFITPEGAQIKDHDIISAKELKHYNHSNVFIDIQRHMQKLVFRIKRKIKNRGLIKSGN